MYQFGISNIWVNPISGNLATNPTPHHLGTVESASIDISATNVPLVGQNQWPDDVAVGEKKGSGKLVFGQIEVDLFNQIFFADTTSTALENMSVAEQKTVPSTPFQVTVTNSGTFLQDWGVEFLTTSGSGQAKQRFRKVASAPAAGQYSVSAGVYTFNTADQGAIVGISYTYNVPATGLTVTANQQFMGYGPTFELFIAEQYNQAAVGVNYSNMHVFACKLSKLNKALKNKDYLKPEVDFEFFANSAGQVLKFAQANLA